MSAARCSWSQCQSPAVASVGYVVDLGTAPAAWYPYCQEHLELPTINPNHREGMVRGAAENGRPPVFVVIDQRVPEAKP